MKGNQKARSKFMCRRLTLAGCVLYFASFVVQAHHSFAIYDAANPVEIAGVVERFQFANPHSMVVLNVANEDGSTTQWRLDAEPINMLSRVGWAPDSLQSGDYIRVMIHPLRTGQTGGRLLINGFLEGPDSLPPLAKESYEEEAIPAQVEMSAEQSRNFNGIWLSADPGIHFDPSAPSPGEQQPPLTPDYLQRWEDKKAAAREGIVSNDPTANCAPGGFPRMLNMVFPGEILQAEHQMIWYAEWNEEILRIYLDGRPAPEDFPPSYRGFTSGYWEDDTLVTHTSGLRADTLIDQSGIPHSDLLEATMRFRKLTPDFFQVEVTLTDPIAFSQPWTVTKNYQRAPDDYFVQEYNCFEANQHRLNEDGILETDI